MFCVLTTLGDPSVYDLVFALSSNSGKLLVATDLVGVEVKKFSWFAGILSLPLIGVVSGIFDRLAGTASDDFGCGDENTKPMLIIPTFLTAAILIDGTAKSYYKKMIRDLLNENILTNIPFETLALQVFQKYHVKIFIWIKLCLLS